MNNRSRMSRLYLESGNGSCPHVHGEHTFPAGRSSDSPALSAAFPFQSIETVAIVADRVPFTELAKGRITAAGPSLI